MPSPRFPDAHLPFPHPAILPDHHGSNIYRLPAQQLAGIAPSPNASPRVKCLWALHLRPNPPAGGAQHHEHERISVASPDSQAAKRSQNVLCFQSEFSETEPSSPARRCRSRPLFLGDVGFNLLLVGVIVCQRGVHLSEVQMWIFEGNLLGGHSHLVPAHNSPDSQSRPGDLRTPAAYRWIPVNQGPDFHA